jgi:hypothetical protein
MGSKTKTKVTNTPEVISKLESNEVFVFGSNLHGFHYGGAAHTAYRNFGAVWGVAEGLRGKTYAIPTLDENMEKVSEDDLKNSISKFIAFAKNNSKLKFYLTKIGCGIAGWDVNTVKKLFWECIDNTAELNSLPSNIIIPEEFEQ